MAAVAVESEIKERPILFKGDMVKAILEGKKTQTRRVIKPMPFIDYPTGFRLQKEYKLEHHVKCSFVQANMLCDCHAIYEPWKIERIAACPYGKVGARLWVRETFALSTVYEKDSGNQGQLPETIQGTSIWYKAGGGKHFQSALQGRWRPSIFMPRWASRIHLEVTNIRVEQINLISLEDIEAEGTPEGLAQSSRNDGYARYQDFKVLWNSINEKRGFGWETKPFVLVVEFKRLETPAPTGSVTP